MPRFELEMDEATRVALQRLAAVEDRSMSATVRVLIRQAAINRGLWTPVKPQLVEPPCRKPSELP